MSEILCAGCHRAIVGSDDQKSRNWYCKPCNRFGARECLVCGRTPNAVVPRDDLVRQSPLVAGMSALEGAVTRVRVRASLYCDPCYHNAYFVTEADDTRTCLVCARTWDRRVSADHAVS